MTLLSTFTQFTWITAVHLHQAMHSLKYPTSNFVLHVIFWVLALSCAMGTRGAHAQEYTLAPSAALSCLSRSAGASDKPAYPPEAYARKVRGLVKVTMVFNAPDQAPRVSVDDENVNEELVDSVQDYVKDYRLPCLRKGGPAITLRQEFLFEPNDGRKVMSTTPDDDDDTLRKSFIACIQTGEAKKALHYPAISESRAKQGNFLVNLTFSSPTEAPEVQWLAETYEPAMHDVILDYVKELRMPCLQKGPVNVSYYFRFMLEGGDSTVFKDMPLVKFLRAAKSFPRPAYFDMTSMACPFDLRITYRQPYVSNVVSELETTNANRKPLIDWLAKIALDIPERKANQLLGDTFTLSVPCGAIDL